MPDVGDQQQKNASTRSFDQSGRIAFLGFWVAAYFAIGLAPYEVSLDQLNRIYLLTTKWSDATLNFLYFIPFGFVIASFGFVRRPVLSAALFCLFISFIVESVQVVTPGRFPQLADLFFNALGGLFGALIRRR